jgi:molecular chaperone Hsp33
MNSKTNKGKLTTILTEDGSVRLIFADSTGIVQTSVDIHHPSKTVTAALGRCLTAASIMGSQLKIEGSTLTLRILGDGPAGDFVCIADNYGNVRGCCENPQVELPPNSQGKLDVSGVVGKNGDIYVVRDYGFGEPYTGYSKIVSGEIAEDITNYYNTSEQTVSVCALGVRVFPDGAIRGAGGFLLQLMPGAAEEIIPQLQANIDSLGSLSALIAEGKTASDISDIVLKGMPYSILEESEMEYKCNCERDKYRRAIKSLGILELADMRDSGEEAEIICRFCGTRYTFSQEELGKMFEERKQELKSAQETQ